MQFGHRTAASIAALAMIATTFAVADAQTPAAPTDSAGPRSVTLITGDRVLLPKGANDPVVRPAPGRDHIAYSTRRVGESLYVTPADAVPAITAGRLDRRLFDVTGLIAAGYDDRRADLPLITTADAATTGLRTTADIPSVGLRAVTAEKSALAATWPALAATGRVWLDGERTATLDRSVAQIGAPEAWEAGLTGVGVTVAVLDTGVDQTHPDLAERETAERNFTDDPDAVDHYGHGTHVASTIAGTGTKYRGVAPDAGILDGKVLNSAGTGQESWILQGMAWAVEQGADIVNMSLGGTDTADLDPLETAVNTLSAEHGTLFVIAAGNSGPGAGSLGSPGTADAALTVGAVDRDDALATFSSRGPRVGDGAIKPDITAPGVGIAAAESAAGVIGDPVEPGYVALSGTSMATPHVAGAAALLAQANPLWPGPRLKAALTASATPTAGESAFAQGSGRVEVPAALRQRVTTAPTSVSLGTQRWPHSDDTPVTKDVTYHNSGTAPVTLDLSVRATGPDGAPAPAGMLTVTPARLTVPADGTAVARVTGDTRVGTKDGAFSGSVLASAAGATLRTPVAVDREVESYDLTLRAIGPDGTPAAAFDALLMNKAGGPPLFLSDPDGEVQARLPKGDYLLDTLVVDDTADRLYHVAQPVLTVNADAAATADARQTRPIRLDPDDAAAEFAIIQVNYAVFFPSGSGVSVGIGSTDPDALSTQHAGPEVEGLAAMVGSQWSTPDSAYYLTAHRAGSAFTGLDRTVPRAELATVRSSAAATGPGRWGEDVVSGRPPSGLVGMLFVGKRRALPADFTTHHSAAGTSWSGGLWEYAAEDGANPITDLSTPDQTLTAGQTYPRELNSPVFAPAFGGVSWADRVQDQFVLNIPFAGDGAGNAGWSSIAEGSTTLFRDGTEIAASEQPGSGYFAVPAAAGEYRLAIEADRGTVFPTSTRIAATWTFQSTGSPDEATALPLSAVHLAPDLAADGTGTRGVPLAIPVTLDRNGGGQATPSALTAQVSYDDGGAWQPADVADGAVTVAHPADADSVSLRVTAITDSGTAELTVIRAYLLSDG